MKFFNTLGRRLEEFKPIDNAVVKIYNCGPTVYDYAHIGNLRAYVFNDTLRRSLEAAGYKVKQVVNITDVGHLTSDEDEGEDKLQSGAKREGKTVWQVAEHYTQAFKSDVAELNIEPPNGYDGRPDGYARATDFIEEQLAIIKLLLEKGYAYQTQQAIYFEVSRLDGYGELTGQKLSDKEVAVRSQVITDSSKRHPQDFAVWFFKVGRFEHHEMSWSSPWGEGFPGWHLECSAIIHATLGEPIDIHTGGIDHIGTHHTNEIAQTKAAYGRNLANYWLHNEYLLVDNRRMAKSSGNFVTLKSVTEKGFNPLALRLLFLQAHYRSQQNFTWESLSAAQQALTDLYAWADLSWQAAEQVDGAELLARVQAAVGNDLNTAQALAAIYGAAKQKPTQQLLIDLDRLLGLDLSVRKDISGSQKGLIEAREEARLSKKWDKADQLRLELKAHGLEINDTPNGPIWSRIK